MQLLFVQGGGEGTHDAWDNKLVDSLARELGRDADIHYPRMPEADPSYKAWKSALVDAGESLPDGTILVGHSLGGAFLLHALAEQDFAFKPRALMLIAAPFIGAGGWPSDELEMRAETARRLPARLPIHLYHGTADQDVPIAHAALYARALPQAVLHRLPDHDHQLNNDLSAVAADIRLISR